MQSLTSKDQSAIKQTMRIAFLNTHPIQYNAPLYAYLNAEPDLDVTVLYLSDFSVRGDVDVDFGREVKWDIDLLSGYRSVFLGDAAARRRPGGFFSMVAPELWSEIRSGRYDALVIHGHNYLSHHLALIAAQSIKLPVYMRCETHLGLSRSPIKSLLRKPLLGWFYRHFAGFLAIGTANKEFYYSMGVSEEKIFHVPYAVDNDRFARLSALESKERMRLRLKWSIPSNVPTILFAAKLQERKHPDDLLRACAVLSREGVKFHLLMAGSGEMESRLRMLAADLPSDTVSFLGFVNQSELPELYGVSDVFVLPSTDEPWGLAINEAMAAGLAVVASREIGAARDIVIDGVNGRVFNARDVDALAAVLRDVVEDSNKRRSMGEASQSIIAQWGYAECLRGIRKALARQALQPQAHSRAS